VLFKTEAYDAKGRVDFCLHPTGFTVPDITDEAERFKGKQMIVTVFTSNTPNETPDINKVTAYGVRGRKIVPASYYRHKPISDMALTPDEIEAVFEEYNAVLAREKRERFSEIYGRAKETVGKYQKSCRGKDANMGWLQAAMADACLEALGYGDIAVIPTDLSQARPGARKLINDYLEKEHVLLGFFDGPMAAPATAFTRQDKMKIIKLDDCHGIIGRGGDPIGRIPLNEMKNGLAETEYHAASYLHTVLDHTGAEKMVVYNDDPSYVWSKFKTLRKFFNKAGMKLELPELRAIEKTIGRTLLEKALL